jgi:filamentous hemagglutinin family protein
VAVRRLALVSLAALAFAQAASAQSFNPEHLGTGGRAATSGGGVSPPAGDFATVIVPDSGTSLDLGTVVDHSGNTWTIDGGTLAGSNLFHSFSNFDLASGDIARWVHSWGDPAAIDNVISRVTGGDPSHIFGTIDSTGLPNAAFFFINPAGIVFGEGAQINVPAAAHFSTASELRFASGPSFSVATPNGSTFSVAAPQAFGFLGGEGAMLLSGLGEDFAPNHGALSFSGSDIAIEDSAFRVGSIAATAVGDQAASITLSGETTAPLGGSVTLIGANIWTEAPNPEAGASGEIRLTGANVSLSASTLSSSTGTFVDPNHGGTGNPDDVHDGGSITLSGQNVLLDQSFVATNTFGPGAGGDIVIGATGSVDIVSSVIAADTNGDAAAGGVLVAGDTINVTDSSLFSDTFQEGAAGAVLLLGNDIAIDRAWITSESRGTGASGAVAIQAQNSLSIGLTTISSNSASETNAGAILLQGRTVAISESSIASNNSGGGNAGAVGISADEDLTIMDTSVSSTAEAFCTGCTGDAGLVSLAAGGNVTLTGANLFTNVSDTGTSGGVFVTADGAIDVQDSFMTADRGIVGLVAEGALNVAGTTIYADNFGSESSEGGAILLDGSDVSVAYSYITSENYASGEGTGTAGLVTITADNALAITDGTTISVDTHGDGDAGSLVLGGTNILVDASTITSGTTGSGNAGGILINATESLDLSHGATVRSETSAAGDAGVILIEAGDMTLDGSRIATSALENSEGDAGTILIKAASLNVLNDSRLVSNTDSTGNAGNIAIEADEVNVTNGSRISSDSNLQCFVQVCEAGERLGGDAGSVAIDAKRVSVVGSSGTITFISSDTFGHGAAGNVTIKASESLTVTDGGFISSDTYAQGDAGEIGIQAGKLVLDRNGAITSSSYWGAEGDAGSIGVEADEVTVTKGAGLSTSAFGFGDAGDINIEAGSVIVSGESAFGVSYISSDTADTGEAGDVTITADTLTVAHNAVVSSETFGSGNAGFVEVQGGDVLVTKGGRITTEAAEGSSGDAGVVLIEANSLKVARGGAVSSSTAGEGDAGNVLIGAGTVEVDGGEIGSTAKAGATGRSGSLFIDASRRIAVTGGGRISTESNNQNAAGTVFLSAPTVLVSGAGSTINSANNSQAGGDAGFIEVQTLAPGASGITVAEGGRISTSSVAGAAGNIDLQMAPGSLLILEGRNAPGVLETSSGPGTGGVILISNPFAIISNGGNILALGESGGANVRIGTNYFISSSDRPNRVEVSGSLVFENAIYDVSSGIVNPDLSVLDASAVLRGQCPAVRSTGQLSQFTVRPVGPYSPRATDSLQPVLEAPEERIGGSCL